MSKLTERRKADREEMARRVETLCTEYGASCEVRDCATHIWSDGSRPLPETRNRLVLSISLGEGRVGIEFSGDRRRRDTDVFCMPWNTAMGSKAHMTPAFGRAVGATVNPFHRAKCMGFADGFDMLLARLGAALDCIASGEAFELLSVDERILKNGRGDEARINLASEGRYAVAIGGRIIQGATVELVRDKAARLGWS